MLNSNILLFTYIFCDKVLLSVFRNVNLRAEMLLIVLYDKRKLLYSENEQKRGDRPFSFVRFSVLI